jgi:photosystem II stability/assembly factor-like uncharacterized protein
MQRPSSLLRTPVAVAAALLALSAVDLSAQVERNIPTDPTSYDTTYFSGLEWRNLGPNRGGRSVGVAGSDTRPLEYYFGAAGGGLWKTTDGGTTWRPVTDGQIGSSSVGAVAVCQADPDVVYIGTGETQLRGNIIRGDGLYKSTDAGETWTHIGLAEARNFSRVRVHPTDCNTVFAAAFGHYGAENEERGVYKSTDGGVTWRKVLYRDARTGAADLSIHPVNPDLVYATLWEAWRKPWGMSSGGPGSGIFRSTDGGETWTEITRNPGLIPEGMLVGKSGISVSPVDQNRVFAIVEADSGGVFRSDDGGATWTRTNDERKLRQRAFYYTRIYADTQDRDRVYVLNVGFYRSDDGGEEFDTAIRVPHGDNHDLWIATNDSSRMVEGNDGGANVTVNGGETWTEQDYPTAQIYRLTVTNHDPYFLCGGQQDNSTICVPSNGWDHLLAGGVNAAGDTGDYGYSVGGCESGYIANDPRNHDIYYAGCYGGALERYDHRSGQTRAVNVWPENPMGQSAEDLRERVQWTFPILFDPQDDNVLYTATQHVWRSTNEGQSWERISPDLTRAAPETLGPSGGPITKDQTGVETYATVFAIAPSRLEPDVIWTGSDDGLVHVTRDNGRTWQDITPSAAPDFLKITTVEDSPHRAGTAFLVGHRNLLGDQAPYVYRTSDYGRSWTSITRGLPDDEIARSIREDLERPGLLFLGTERGVWVSFDDGLSWQRLQRNLPSVQVSDLAVTGEDLAIATHGRSFWILPSIAFLRQMTPAVSAESFHLFRPGAAVRGVDRGVAVDYFLRSPVEEVTVEVLDRDGQVIRTFTGEASDTAEAEEEEESWRRPRQGDPSVKAGMNRFIWDLRYPGYTDFPGMILWAARNAGPMAVPGTYSVRVTAGGRTQTRPFEVKTDPRIEGVSIADLQRRFDLAMQIRDEVSRANEAVLLIRGVNQQIDSTLARTEDQRVSAAARELKTRLETIEEEIYQVRNQSNQDPLNYPIRLNNKLAALLGHVEGAESAPTDASYEVFSYLRDELDERLTALDTALDRSLPPLNEQLSERGLPRIERVPLEVDDEDASAEVEETGEEEFAEW